MKEAIQDPSFCILNSHHLFMSLAGAMQIHLQVLMKWRYHGNHHQSRLARHLQTARDGQILHAMKQEMGRKGAFVIEAFNGIAQV